MVPILARRATARERVNDAAPCGTTAKADLRAHLPACDMRTHAAEVLERTHKQEYAADLIGISQSRLSHKLKDGTVTVKELEALGPDFLAGLGKQLTDSFGPLAASPPALVRQKAKDLRALADELDQLAGYMEEAGI